MSHPHFSKIGIPQWDRYAAVTARSTCIVSSIKSRVLAAIVRHPKDPLTHTRRTGCRLLRLAGWWGGGGGGVAPRPPCSRSGQRPAVLLSGSLRVAGALPSGARVRSGLKCRPGVGGGEGRPVDRSPGGPS